MRTISIVVPALNEEGNIQGTLDSVKYAAGKYFDDYEIIIVNDGSIDRTLDIVHTNMREDNRIRVISHQKPGGFGFSYNDGRMHARMQFCIMIHGDNAFSPETLSHFLSFAGKADVVCGYIANPHSRNLTRRLVSCIYTGLMNVLFGLRLKYFNGLQIHRNEWLQKLKLKSTGFGFQAELLIKALRGGNSYVEVPYVHSERPGGGATKIFKVKNIVSVIGTIVKLYRANSIG